MEWSRRRGGGHVSGTHLGPATVTAKVGPPEQGRGAPPRGRRVRPDHRPAGRGARGRYWRQADGLPGVERARAGQPCRRDRGILGEPARVAAPGARGPKTGRPSPDSFNEVQVSERAQRTPAELLAELRAIAPRLGAWPPTPPPAAAPRADARRRRALPRLADVGRPDPGRLDAPRRPGPRCRRSRWWSLPTTTDGWSRTSSPTSGRATAGRTTSSSPDRRAGASRPVATGRSASSTRSSSARILAGRAPADGLPHPQVYF